MKITALALVPLAALSLTGCTAIMDLARSESEAHFDDRVALLVSDVIAADEVEWMPEDATDITLRQSTKANAPATAVIGFTSDSDLVGCTETERLSLPVYAVEWGPDDTDIVKATTVQSCGDWVFVPTADGWFGWTPSAPDEKAAA